MTTREHDRWDVPVIMARTIAVDLRANTLSIDAMLPSELQATWPEDAASEATVAMLDIGVRGRLLGLECEGTDAVPPFALSIADPDPADLSLMRSVEVPLRLIVDRQAERMVATIARSGAEHELAWPSGNQCWRRAGTGVNGEPVMTCAVVISPSMGGDGTA